MGNCYFIHFFSCDCGTTKIRCDSDYINRLYVHIHKHGFCNSFPFILYLLWLYLFFVMHFYFLFFEVKHNLISVESHETVKLEFYLCFLFYFCSILVLLYFYKTASFLWTGKFLKYLILDHRWLEKQSKSLLQLFYQIALLYFCVEISTIWN